MDNKERLVDPQGSAANVHAQLSLQSSGGEMPGEDLLNVAACLRRSFA
jgi:hypothetical protein